jgi:hypothetical protein
MAMFAVLNENNEVINTIVADTLEIAEEATKTTCIEFTYDNPAFHLSKWDGSTFIPLATEG